MIRGGRFIESDFFQSFIAEEVTNEVENRANKKQKRRAMERCCNLWDTNWGKMLLNPSTADCETWEGKKFRRRFRIDYRMFRDIIVPLCKDSNVFEMKISSRIPIEFKVLVALRIWGEIMIAILYRSCLQSESPPVTTSSANLS